MRCFIGVCPHWYLPVFSCVFCSMCLTASPAISFIVLQHLFSSSTVRLTCSVTSVPACLLPLPLANFVCYLFLNSTLKPPKDSVSFAPAGQEEKNKTPTQQWQSLLDCFNSPLCANVTDKGPHIGQLFHAVSPFKIPQFFMACSLETN